MNRALKILGLFPLCLLGIVGCAHIPQADHQLEIQRSFNAGCDKVWDAALAETTASQGTVITSDQASGVLVFSIPAQEAGSRMYLNVYVKCDTTGQRTTVYVIPRLRDKPYLPAEQKRSADADFLEMLQQRL